MLLNLHSNLTSTSDPLYALGLGAMTFIKAIMVCEKYSLMERYKPKFVHLDIQRRRHTTCHGYPYALVQYRKDSDRQCSCQKALQEYMVFLFAKYDVF